ncbi:glycine C-acetyltransferase [Paraburkholderia phenoliruptrix]|uniref:2-amino-3-ketobutyrate coenzyme A ligase n=2 Tax=Paraburkholderia phenoliruptrix TaxID=252970 RepID=K0DRX1_9BURK|nr:glycine C-acetyltransferase [Paraburkholderia phenoliruptrix]AFT88796.1 glycine C-acetyltransferase [Paraburkholderia phenoliruptrix BR3459a]MDR6423511.1 glycine C-acetyltransferase [Paraburkholderia phenoliruptrix]CAB4052087.1 2-amino-3-ketobutyrate coenzyme A ligase [Paraburkholderia phenoliruptrix]
MRDPFLAHLRGTLEQIRADGFYKSERVIASPQSADIRLANGQDVLNFCANNYLGLADDARLIEAAKQGLDADGFGMASVRFICGTQTVHKQLEQALAEFLQTDDCILYSSCFDANGGLFETLLDENDAIISDELNHASIIDGVRLSKAKRFRYKNNDLADLESKLKEADAAGARFKLIATDGVFSMDGIIADLAGICDLADRYGALVMVDDSHAVGFVGAHGRGTPEHCGVLSRVDIVTGTLGKALGGASGGYVAARKEIVELLRQRSRPYLFSNTLTPSIAAASLKVLELLASDEGAQLRARVRENGAHFRSRMSALGFTLVPGEHPIIPVMLGDAQLASKMADALLNEGVYVIGFSFPVVPRGRARIRTQMSAAHTTEQIDRAVDAFARVGRELGVIPAEGA